MLLVRKFMVISIFYAVCGLSVLFFAAFFLQCCRSSAKKTKHLIRKLPIDDSFASAQTTRLFAQWEKELAEFMARQGRSTVLGFLIAGSLVAPLRSTSPNVRSTPVRINRRTAFVLSRSAFLGRSQGLQILCKKN